MKNLVILSCFFSCALLVSSMGANLNSDVTLYFIADGPSIETSSDSDLDCESGGKSGSNVYIAYTSSDTVISFTGFEDEDEIMQYSCMSQTIDSYWTNVNNPYMKTEYNDLFNMLSSTDNQVLPFSCTEITSSDDSSSSDDSTSSDKTENFMFINGAYGVQLNYGDSCMIGLNASETIDMSVFEVMHTVNGCGLSGTLGYGNFTALISLVPTAGSADLYLESYTNSDGGNSISITTPTTYSCLSFFNGLGTVSLTCSQGTDVSLAPVVFMLTPFQNGQVFLETITAATDLSSYTSCVTTLSAHIVHVLAGLLAFMIAQLYL